MEAHSPPDLMYIWGRPHVPLTPWLPSRIEKEVASLCDRCRNAAETGGRHVVVAGDWASEGLLQWILKLAANRLARGGWQVEVCGQDAVESAIPRRPASALALLWDAPAYESLDVWLHPRPGQAVLLAGLDTDLESRGLRPDVCFDGSGTEGFLARLDPHIADVRQTWNAANESARAGLLLNALGAFAPRALFRAMPPALFVALPGGGSSSVSVPLPWVAWHELKNRPIEELRSALASAPRLLGDPGRSLLDRAARRLRLRGLSL